MSRLWHRLRYGHRFVVLTSGTLVVGGASDGDIVLKVVCARCVGYDHSLRGYHDGWSAAMRHVRNRIENGE